MRCQRRRRAGSRATRWPSCLREYNQCMMTFSLLDYVQDRLSNWNVSVSKVVAAALLHQKTPCCPPGLGCRLQWIRCFVLCDAGVGDEHAKWSPVATTWYRLLPEVLLLSQPEGQLAIELVQQLPGLLQLAGSGSKDTLVVGDVRKHLNLLEKVRWLPCTLFASCQPWAFARFPLRRCAAWRARSGMHHICSCARSRTIFCSPLNQLEPGNHMSCLLTL